MGNDEAIVWLTQHWPYLISVVAVLVGVWRGMVYLQNGIRQDKLRRCDEVTKSYIEYQQLCLEHPHLAASSYGAPPVHLAEEDIIRRNLMFDVATSIFERAFLAVRQEGPPEIKQSQWPGWRTYILDFISKVDYREWWSANVFDLRQRPEKNHAFGSQYDERFERYMYKLFNDSDAL